MRKVLLGLSLVGLVGCAEIAGTDPGGSSGPSANQAEAFAEQFASSFGSGLSGFSASIVARADEILDPRDPVASVVPINAPFFYRTTCTAGGRIETSGSITGNIDTNGSGVLLLGAQQTTTDWRCIPPFIINGHPYLSMTGQINFLNGQMSSAASFNFGGGIKWGTRPEDGWQINLTVLINPDGSGRVSGVMGRYSINRTF